LSRCDCALTALPETLKILNIDMGLSLRLRLTDR